MKTILTVIFILISTTAFAGDVIIKAPAPGETDTYIITNSDGRSEGVHVVDIDGEKGGDYAIINSEGETTIITSVD